MVQRVMWLGAIVTVVISVAAMVARYSQENSAMAADEKKAKEAQLAHMVFFTLKDSSEANRKRLVDACKKHLDGHDGVVYFSVGTLNDDLKRPVNDRDYDVALHLVFRNRAAHDRYQEHPRHKEFVDLGPDLWTKVRVFDSDVK
ncbi:MAG: Dabb family protein [Pirellulales bacterium]